MYTIEPTDHWRAGDRAYCIRGAKQGDQYLLERGRMYTVAEARQYRGVMPDGLRLHGVDTGEVWGFWSNRFVCVRGRDLPIRQIAARTARKWLEAYYATANARAASVGRNPKGGDKGTLGSVEDEHAVTPKAADAQDTPHD